MNLPKNFYPFEHPRTDRNRSTRICIGKALVSLLEKHSFESLRVTDIVKEAGVSRMTFYKYYPSKLDALNDYFHEIITEYDIEQQQLSGNNFFEEEHILHCIRFFEQYTSLLLVLLHANQHTAFFQTVQQYIETKLTVFSQADGYDSYYYAGAIIGIFCKWMINGKRETPERLAEIICQLSCLSQTENLDFSCPHEL